MVIEEQNGRIVFKKLTLILKFMTNIKKVKIKNKNSIFSGWFAKNKHATTIIIVVVITYTKNIAINRTKEQINIIYSNFYLKRDVREWLNISYSIKKILRFMGCKWLY